MPHFFSWGTITWSSYIYIYIYIWKSAKVNNPPRMHMRLFYHTSNIKRPPDDLKYLSQQPRTIYLLISANPPSPTDHSWFCPPNDRQRAPCRHFIFLHYINITLMPCQPNVLPQLDLDQPLACPINTNVLLPPWITSYPVWKYSSLVQKALFLLNAVASIGLDNGRWAPERSWNWDCLSRPWEVWFLEKEIK